MQTQANTAFATSDRDADEPADIDLLLSKPGEYFGFSRAKAFGMTNKELDILQLAGLKRRFGQFRGKLPMMDKLADLQNVHAIEHLNDVLPLLFDHATYKSYPPSLLEKHRYPQLTAWLNKLTTVDLSGLDVSHCHSIDDWLMTIDRETPLAVCHTSGTSGSMSFLPWSKGEWRKMLKTFPLMYCDDFGPKSTFPLNLDCIYPFFRSGGLSHTVINDAIRDVIAGAEERLHTAYPQRLSADLLLLATKRRVAAVKGELDSFHADPELETRHAEFAAQQREMPNHVSAFFEAMRSKLAGKRVFVLATSNLLTTLAEDGLKRGLRRVFAPDSVIITGGGGKGMVLPDDWQDKVKEFFGVERLHNNYGMSELMGQFASCTHGNNHGTPWLIPYLLDGDNKPLPREGTATGRFAAYDLLMDTRWGGFVTGDEVTMEWDKPCACGQLSPYIVKGSIRRFSEKKNDGGEEKLSCAAAPEAYAEALDFLNGGPA